MFGQHKNLDEFFAFQSQEERNNYFRIRTDRQLQSIYPLLAEDERLTVTAILELEHPYQANLVHHIIGERSKGLNSLGRMFTVRSTGKNKVLVSRGTKRNQRQFFEVKGEQVLPAEYAINALHKYGPNSSIECHRGQLEEVIPNFDPEPEPIFNEPTNPSIPVVDADISNKTNESDSKKRSRK